MCHTLLVIYYSFVLGFGTIERQHYARVAESARAVQLGATQREVLKILGRPSGRYAPFRSFLLGIGARPAQWYYGSSINIDKTLISDFWLANIPLPVNIRFFWLRRIRSDYRME